MTAEHALLRWQAKEAYDKPETAPSDLSLSKEKSPGWNISRDSSFPQINL